MSKFKIGDRVRIISRGYCYDVYYKAAVQMKLLNWAAGEYYEIGDVGEIIVIEPHEYSNADMYGIRFKDEREFIFGEEALELVDSKISLELTQEEARTLFVLTGNVTGDTFDSPRKHTDKVYTNLKKALYLETSQDTAEHDLFSTNNKYGGDYIHFANYPVQEPEPDTTINLNVDTSEAKAAIEELKALLEQVEVIKNRIFKGE